VAKNWTKSWLTFSRNNIFISNSQPRPCGVGYFILIMAGKVEIQPHKAFIPQHIRCLVLGSFPGKDQTGSFADETKWFYGAPRNQFWKVLEIVYGKELKTKQHKQQLFEAAGIGIADIIRSCIRTKGTNLDENLEIVDYNIEAIEWVLKQWHPKVFFTSRFVEKLFRKFFPAYEDTDLLPSPSPRYFRLSVEEKARIYKLKLPRISH
jgi:hypoxanthine-DNA glycosylase